MPLVGFELTISAGEQQKDLRLRPRGHWDRHNAALLGQYFSEVYCVILPYTSYQKEAPIEQQLPHVEHVVLSRTLNRNAAVTAI
jgi:hypothetical protein